MTREPFRPYPRVWEAFAGDSEAWERLESGLTFESVAKVSLTLAREGKEAARVVLMGCFPPPLPKSVQEVLKRAGKKIPFEHRQKTPAKDLAAPPGPEPEWRAGGSEEYRKVIKDLGQF